MRLLVNGVSMLASELVLLELLPKRLEVKNLIGLDLPAVDVSCVALRPRPVVHLLFKFRFME